MSPSTAASEPFASGEQADDQHPIDFAIGEAGLRVKLQDSNPELLMSALGQKQTFGLPPINVRYSPKSGHRA